MNQRSDALIAKVRGLMEKYTLCGMRMTQAGERIKKELGLATYSTSTMHADYKAVQKSLMLDEETAERLRARSVRFLQMAKAEAMESWEKSKLDSVKTKKRQKGLPTGGKGGASGADGGITTTEVQQEQETIKGGTGDVKYLQAAMNAQKQIDELLGTNAPVKTENETKLTIAESMIEALTIDE